MTRSTLDAADWMDAHGRPKRQRRRAFGGYVHCSAFGKDVAHVAQPP